MAVPHCFTDDEQDTIELYMDTGLRWFYFSPTTPLEDVLNIEVDLIITTAGSKDNYYHWPNLTKEEVLEIKRLLDMQDGRQPRVIKYGELCSASQMTFLPSWVHCP